MLDTTKRTLATLTAATFLGVGGWAFAANQSGTATTDAIAASQTTTTQSTTQAGHPGHRHGPRGEALSGDVLAKVTAAVQAKLAGSSVEHAMKAPDGTYHARVEKADGSHVHVALNAQFQVTSVDQGRPGHGPGHHGRP